MADAPTLIGGRYEVLRTVSTGHRASVVQALDTVHDRLVALKIYPAGADRDALLAEARLLMSMTPHPGLPVVRGDLFTDDGSEYVVVMNWIDGTDLQHLLDADGAPGLPLDDVIEDLAQAAAALDHLHAHEPPIVHGDVKPANLVRSAAGRVVLVDFDLAGAQTAATRVGTIGFVAPEVTGGDKPGPAADVYGLAATAVTLLNGDPPDVSTPTYPHIEPPEKGHVARVLRSAMASDPIRRPRSAGRLVANLRSAGRGELPTGVVALLATEVAGAGPLWRRDPAEIRVAMARLRDVRDAVVDRFGGHVVASMNEGDRTIAAFREASAAALAALALHDEVATAVFPPDIDVRLRAAVGVGEALHTDGVYSGAIVDQVVELRAAASPGSTVTVEATAELLLGLVGRDVSIVPMPRPPGEPGGAAGPVLFELTRPGREPTAPVAATRSPATSPTDQATPVREPAAPWPPSSVDQAASVPDRREPVRDHPPAPRRADAILDAIQHPASLVALLGAGLAAIWLLVLAPELGGQRPAAVVLAVALAGLGVSVAARLRAGAASRRQAVEIEGRAEAAQRELHAAVERVTAELAASPAGDAAEGRRLLAQLVDEQHGISDLLAKNGARLPSNLVAALTEFCGATFRQGVSALSDAVELLAFARHPDHARLVDELATLEARLDADEATDPRDRERDIERRDARRRLLARHDAAGARSQELLFGVERCATALAEARFDVASAVAGDTSVDVDGVVGSLQATVRHVGEVQAEIRLLADGAGGAS